jgi:aspartyl-tRNA(Asn)/glutamyl-tRNA(Gln) amidotransferase subunit A
VNEYVERLRAAGHTVEGVELPIAKYALAMYYIIVPAEVSSNLARYDGVRFGRRAEGVDTLAELYGKSRDEGFMTENKRRIMIGSYVLSSGYYDAYYLKAQKARTLLIEAFDKLFETYDMLIGPVTPTPAFGLGENTSDPIKMYLADIMTVPASLAGLPAVSVPSGETHEGLPVGVQLIGPRRSDAKLLALARAMEGSNE